MYTMISFPGLTYWFDGVYEKGSDGTRRNLLAFARSELDFLRGRDRNLRCVEKSWKSGYAERLDCRIE
jgi:hypothetical protein